MTSNSGKESVVMRTVNKILSVILSVCIVACAVIAVSAGSTGGSGTDFVKDPVSDVFGTVTANDSFSDAVTEAKNVDENEKKSDGSDMIEAISEKDPTGEKSNGVTVPEAKSDVTKNVSEQAAEETREGGVPNGVKNVTSNGVVYANSYEQEAIFNTEDTSELFLHTYSDSFFSSTDSSAYLLSSESRGAIVCEISHKSLSAGAYKLRLYMKYSPNGDGKTFDWRLINELETTAAGGTFKTAETGVYAGTYKAVVTCLNKNVPDKEYTVLFRFIENGGYETECNDTATRYNEIAPGQTVKGSASYFSDSKDIDWYMFRVYENGAVTFTFDHEKKDLPSVCWKITVYDENGNELYSDNSYFSTESLRSGRIGVQKGCYYIKVENRVYYDVTYSLKLHRYTDLPYESEYNDTAECANTITAGVSVTGEISSRSSGSDTDWYKLVLTENGYCVFSLTHAADETEKKNVQDGDTPKYGWRITVKNGNDTLYSAITSWDETGTESPEIGLGAGTYLIKIDSIDLYRNSTPYTLTASFEPSSSWESEPNGTFETADALLPNTAKTGTTSSFETGDRDDDYYVFTLTEKSRVAVSLSHEAVPAADKSIYIFGLYNSSHGKVALTDEKGVPLQTSGANPVYSKSSFGDGRAVYAYATLDAGTYYVKVNTGLQYESIRYNLILTVSEVK